MPVKKKNAASMKTDLKMVTWLAVIGVGFSISAP
jgi:hypothetical protein